GDLAVAVQVEPAEGDARCAVDGALPGRREVEPTEPDGGGTGHSDLPGRGDIHTAQRHRRRSADSALTGDGETEPAELDVGGAVDTGCHLACRGDRDTTESQARRPVDCAAAG